MSDKKKNVNFDEEVPKNTLETAKRLFGQLKNQRIRLSMVGICIIIYIILTIYTPYYSADVIDRLFETIRQCVASGKGFSMPWESLGKDMFFLCVMYLMTGIFYFLQGYLMASVAEKLILTLREQISAKLNKLPLRFFDANKPGEILSRVTSDLDKVSETLQTGLLKFITALGTLVGALAFMLYYSFSLTILFLVFTVISLFITKLISKKNLESSAKRQEGLAYLTGITEEYYT